MEGACSGSSRASGLEATPEADGRGTEGRRQPGGHRDPRSQQEAGGKGPQQESSVCLGGSG